MECMSLNTDFFPDEDLAYIFRGLFQGEFNVELFCVHCKGEQFQMRVWYISMEYEYSLSEIYTEKSSQ